MQSGLLRNFSPGDGYGHRAQGAGGSKMLIQPCYIALFSDRTVAGHLAKKSGFVAARMSGPSAPAAQL